MPLAIYWRSQLPIVLILTSRRLPTYLPEKKFRGVQRYLADEKMFATSGELTNLREINKQMN